MNTSTQLKALVRNLSAKTNVEAEIILRNYMLERLLERISLSKYRHKFILKGGLLIAAMVGIDTRTTMDLDATLKGQTLSEGEIEGIFAEIIAVPVDDGVTFTLKGIEEIREEADYPGYRVSIATVLDKTRQTIKVDVTTGDFVTPREIEYSFKLMFEDRNIAVLAYNLETVLAEKLETIITRELTNTRMRDFYDVYILLSIQRNNINDGIFAQAVQSTVKKRGSEIYMANVNTTIEKIAAAKVLIELWKRYQSRYSYAADVTWEMVMNAVRELTKIANV